jgi:hypothetical protein
VPTQHEDSARRTWRFETTETLEREIYLLLQHLSGELIHELATLLRPAGITPEQYHVLRILQDAGSAGTPLTAIGEGSPATDVGCSRGWRAPSQRCMLVSSGRSANEDSRR